MTELIIKKASSYSTAEQTSLGILGIPPDWPIECLLYTDSVPEGWEQISDSAFTALRITNQEAYNTWVTPPIDPITAYIIPAIKSAAEYGNRIMMGFCAENVFHGITIPDVVILAEKLHKVITLVNAGSLASAISSVGDVVEDELYCTPARKAAFQQKLQDYLDGNAS